MNFSVTITDATPSELAKIFNALAGTTATIQTATPAVQAAAMITAPLYDPRAPQPVAAEDDTPNAAPPFVDNSGLPWDERIHSATKGINADGSWRKKRGVQDALVSQVEAELRGTMISAPQPDNYVQPAAPVPAMTAPAPLAGGPALPEPPGMNAPVQTTVIPASAMTAPAPVTTPQPVAVESAAPMDYPAFMQRVMAGIQSGTMDNAYIGSVLQRIGAPSITALAPDADKLVQAVAIMRAEGKL